MRSAHRNRYWIIAASVIIVAAAIGSYFIAANWPYRHRKIKPLLESVFGGRIMVTHYHRTYFPNPGFVATGITIQRKSAPNQPAIGTVQTLYVQGHWPDLLLLRNRVELVDMTGFHLTLPAPGSREAQEEFPSGSPADFRGPDTLIERLEIHDSKLDILRDNGGRFSFAIHQLHIEDLQKGRAMRFVVDMENALPSGRVGASGTFGPLNAQNLGATAVSGQFTYESVKLHDLGNVSGTLHAVGHFSGPLNSLEATANGDVPDFAVDDGQPSAVAGSIQCTVNALDGNVVFHSMDLRTGETHIHATGSVVGPPKTTDLNITVTRGRAQDLLRPFLHREVPITGPAELQAHAYLAPSSGSAGFFQRLHVNGAFKVPEERPTDPSVEKSLTAFSDRVQRGNPSKEVAKDAPPADRADAISSLQGPATIRNAVVYTHGLTFEVAGARAVLDGTFNLHTSAVHLDGKLAMQSNISHAATGLKSLLLKPLAPFFKKKNAGAVVPIAVTGAPGSYKVTQNITHSK
jgi:hypothetical protein